MKSRQDLEATEGVLVVDRSPLAALRQEPSLEQDDKHDRPTVMMEAAMPASARVTGKPSLGP